MNIKDYEDLEITPQQKYLMIDASGGPERCFNFIISFLILQRKNVIVVSSSIVVARLLIDGPSAHSTFKIKIETTAASTCNVPVESKQLQNVGSRSNYKGLDSNDA